MAFILNAGAGRALRWPSRDFVMSESVESNTPAALVASVGVEAETNTASPPVATIATLGQHEGETVKLQGWLYNLRESGKLVFPIFRDGTGTVQGVAHVKSVAPEVFEALKGLTQESSVIVTGKVRADKRAPGGYELDVEGVEVVQRVPESDPYPITLKEHGVDFLMEHRHLWVRSPRQSAILRIRAEIMRAAAEYFDHERIHPHRSADSDSGGVRGHLDAVPGGLLRRPGVSHAIWPALH
jgi:lysyl-tRNA synthetase class II